MRLETTMINRESLEPLSLEDEASQEETPDRLLLKALDKLWYSGLSRLDDEIKASPILELFFSRDPESHSYFSLKREEDSRGPSYIYRGVNLRFEDYDVYVFTEGKVISELAPEPEFAELTADEIRKLCREFSRSDIIFKGDIGSFLEELGSQ